MKKPVKNLPDSVKARLTNIAGSTGRPFNEVLQYYTIERFLFRLSCSSHAQHFVLKGALIFYARQIDFRRPTRDIDLQTDTSNAINDVVQTVREICVQPVEPDGITFDPASVKGGRILNRANLQGVRVTCLASLGTAQIPTQIDISYANVITPIDISIAYPTLLDSPVPHLRAYPYETVIAEKLQALVFLGRINDRLKDFYDLWLLSQQVAFNGPPLSAAILATFNHRGTPLPAGAPVALTGDFADAKQKQWAAFLDRFASSAEAIADFARVIGQLREFLLPPMAAAANNTPFTATWTAAGPWQP